MKTFFTFKSTRDFQAFLRRGQWPSGHLDSVTIGKKIFTMHEYDSDGKCMSWGNKKYDQLIECTTFNRYKSWNDAKLYRFTNYGALREDISYIQ